MTFKYIINFKRQCFRQTNKHMDVRVATLFNKYILPLFNAFSSRGCERLLDINVVTKTQQT